MIRAGLDGSIIIFLKHKISVKKGFPGGSDSKNLPAKETRVQSLGCEDAYSRPQETMREHPMQPGLWGGL